MNYNVVNTTRFAKEIKRLVKKFPSLKQEFATLLESISKNPFSGTPLGHNCYKIRISIRSNGKGKSGGARIITHLYLENATVYLLTIYDKSEKPDLLPGELQDMIDALEFWWSFVIIIKNWKDFMYTCGRKLTAKAYEHLGKKNRGQIWGCCLSSITCSQNQSITAHHITIKKYSYYS